MIGLIIAVAILGALLVTTIIVCAKKFNELNETLTNLCECFLMYKDNPDSVNIIEDYSALSNSSKFTFPNSEGFGK